MRSEDEIRSGVNPGVTRALKALGESDRALEAPPEVEARLRAAFRSRVPSNRARNRRIPVWRWIPAVAAAAILAIVAAYYRGPQVPVRVARKTPIASSVAPQRAGVQSQPGIYTHGIYTQVTHAAGRPKAARARNSQPHLQPLEIATDFFPLVDFAPPADDTELVRVNLPASAMREVGLPVREDRLEDRVQADVLVSNGIATAIRFVKNMQ